MMAIKIPYKTVKNSKEAFEAIKKNITVEEIEKYKVKAELKYDEDKKIIYASGSGFELVVKFLEKELELDLQLAFLLKPLKSKISDSLEHKFKKVV
ncbi:MAG: polyhydroxyalkanoic acid system family protein [Bacteriovoracaceae bacterium]|nr:polyhydroxyalkanoic acid system family protein [Bacteriovoracaceae bacterium]